MENKVRMKETTLFVVRHGETFAKTNENPVGAPFVCGSGSEVSRNTHLTEKGKQQMFEVGKLYKNEKFDIAIISDLIRSRESVESFLKGAEQENVDVIVNPQVTEINYGEDDGVSEELVKAKKAKYFAEHPENNNKFDFAFPLAESFLEAGERMKKALNDIAEKFSGKKVLVVSHSGVMRALHLTGGQIINPEAQVKVGQDLRFGEVMCLKSNGKNLEVN